MPEQVVDESRRAQIGRARREKTRGRLVAAAARVVAREGQSKATIDDFIQAAGVARGTFYNYFPTRDHLIDALWSHLGREPFLEIHDRCRKIDDAALRLVVETQLVMHQSGADEVWGWLIYALSGEFEKVNEDLLSFPLPTLREGVRKGRFDVRNVEVVREAVVNVVRGAILAKLMHRSSPEYEESVCEIVLLAAGIDRHQAGALVRQAVEYREAS